MKKQGTYNEKGEKWCSSCKIYEPLHNFGINNHSKDGRNWQCVQSTRKYYTPVPLPVEYPIRAARLIVGDIAIARVYEYQRPDAYDNYMYQQTLITKTHTNESRY